MAEYPVGELRLATVYSAARGKRYDRSPNWVVGNLAARLGIAKEIVEDYCLKLRLEPLAVVADPTQEGIWVGPFELAARTEIPVVYSVVSQLLGRAYEKDEREAALAGANLAARLYAQSSGLELVRAAGLGPPEPGREEDIVNTDSIEAAY
jgi:hypothetical protein